MDRLTQPFTWHITVLSPLHIGNGERLPEQTRWQTDDRLWLVDEMELFKRVAGSPVLLDAFKRFCLSHGQGLMKFLKSVHILPSDVALYSVPVAGGPVGPDYYPFIKMAGHPPLPYIPGSSLKGAVRSVILRGRLLEYDDDRTYASKMVFQAMTQETPKIRKATEQRRKLRPQSGHADDKLEKEFLGHDQHHDYMRLFEFADSPPIPLESLMVTKVRVQSIVDDGVKRKMNDKDILLYPEVLACGTQMTTRVRILEHLRSKLADAELKWAELPDPMQALAKRCHSVAEDQIAQELCLVRQTGWEEGKEFYTELREELERIKSGSNSFLLRLGWGTGYDAKTVTDLLDEITFETAREHYKLGLGRPGRDFDVEPLPPALSPKSRKVALTLDANGKERWLPLGWVRVDVRVPRAGAT